RALRRLLTSRPDFFVVAETSGLVAALAERCGSGQFAGGLGPLSAFALQIIRDRAAQIGIGDVVRRISRLRQIPARQLMLALRAGFDDLQAALDRKIDGLIIADLEMQERVMLDGTPVAAE